MSVDDDNLSCDLCGDCEIDCECCESCCETCTDASYRVCECVCGCNDWNASLRVIAHRSAPWDCVLYACLCYDADDGAPRRKRRMRCGIGRFFFFYVLPLAWLAAAITLPVLYFVRADSSTEFEPTNATGAFAPYIFLAIWCVILATARTLNWCSSERISRLARENPAPPQLPLEWPPQHLQLRIPSVAVAQLA